MRSRCIGILREVKYKWERRAPLAPAQVSKLVQSGVQVLVQPSDRRIFTNGEYSAAGAVITEDISAAHTIFGVKEVVPESLIPGKTYVIFSHVIKAQPYNMGLLDTAVKRRVRLVDYECIRDEQQQRLVAFGRFAGIAGMIDYLRGLGERLLTLGYSTPFMGVSQSYMYPSVEAARRAVKSVGDEIERVGLPAGLVPFSFVFTGSGNVTRGAREIFDLLPYRQVTGDELPSFFPEGLSPSDITDEQRRQLLCCMLRLEDLVQPPEAIRDNKRVPVDRTEYYNSPSRFEPVFHDRIAPYTSVLVNGMYWESRFPRLLTLEQLRALKSRAPSGFVGDSDITCDVGGSVEALVRSTTLESPFFTYDPATGAVTEGLGGPGILLQGVDILPAQFPRDATMHFSSCLEPFVAELSAAQGAMSLSPAISGAVICQDGSLTPSFQYITKLRQLRAAREAAESAAAAAKERAAAAPHAKPVVRTSLEMSGHMFDSGFINKALDLVEFGGAHCVVDRWVLGTSRDTASRCVLTLEHESKEVVDRLVQQIRGLVTAIPAAMATVEVMPATARPSASASGVQITPGASGAPRSVAQAAPTSRRVLVLGSGFVAGPVVEYLAAKGHQVTVASAMPQQAAGLVRGVGGASAVELDATNKEALSAQIRSAHVVVSLLPATMHVPVAELCIEHKVHLVTASYTSPAMYELGERAARQGVTLLNEVGLDPGLDHMSAMEIIHSAKRDGAHVVGFQSLCGGLPAPEAADNPLGYKFSWNPRGVLTASQNPATYLEGGKVVQVPGPQLLRSARPLTGVLPSLALEYLPNRNSLGYMDTYELGRSAAPDAGPLREMFRGTLRYRGFSSVMSGFGAMGLLDPKTAVPAGARHWAAVTKALIGGQGREADWVRFLTDRGLDRSEAEATANAARVLGLTSADEEVDPHVPLMDNFCRLLERQLVYAPGERDMVMMHHRFLIEDGGRGREVTSTLLAYGDEKHTAMASTVGLPAAIAAQMILDGRIERRGTLLPTTPDVYAPILKEMADFGFHFKERSLPLR